MYWFRVLFLYFVISVFASLGVSLFRTFVMSWLRCLCCLCRSLVISLVMYFVVSSALSGYSYFFCLYFGMSFFRSLCLPLCIDVIRYVVISSVMYYVLSFVLP